MIFVENEQLMSGMNKMLEKWYQSIEMIKLEIKVLSFFLC